MPTRRRDREEPDHLTAMGTEGLAGPGFTPDDVFDHARPSYRGHGPVGYTRTDAQVRADVCDELTDDPDVDASCIEVMVDVGIVILTGEVSTRAMKWRAEEVADDVTGVKEVDNRIRVRRPPH
jgi:osmotically-inducible protein OsmY